MPPPILSLVTVNYSSAAAIFALYESLSHISREISWELIVVDNFSCEEEVEKLKNFFVRKKAVHLIFSKKNIGFSRGNNLGTEFCRGKFLAIINPDVEIRQGVFSRLLCTLENPQVGVAVPMLKTRQGKVLENSRKFPTVLSVIKRRLTRKKDLQISKSTFLREIDWAQGSFLVMRKKNFEFVGRFDERYFIFVEDADLCRKFREKKMKIIQDCSVFAYHSEDRLSDGKLFLLKRTFWIHVVSFYKYFRKWGFKKV